MDPSVLGGVARDTQPLLLQVFLGAGGEEEEAVFDRKVRKHL